MDRLPRLVKLGILLLQPKLINRYRSELINRLLVKLSTWSLLLLDKLPAWSLALEVRLLILLLIVLKELALILEAILRRLLNHLVLWLASKLLVEIRWQLIELVGWYLIVWILLEWLVGRVLSIFMWILLLLVRVGSS